MFIPAHALTRFVDSTSRERDASACIGGTGFEPCPPSRFKVGAVLVMNESPAWDACQCDGKLYVNDPTAARFSSRQRA